MLSTKNDHFYSQTSSVTKTTLLSAVVSFDFSRNKCWKKNVNSNCRWSEISTRHFAIESRISVSKGDCPKSMPRLTQNRFSSFSYKNEIC